MTYMERTSTNVVCVLLVLTVLMKECLCLRCVLSETTVLKDLSSCLLALQELTTSSLVCMTLANARLAVPDTTALSLE